MFRLSDFVRIINKYYNHFGGQLNKKRDYCAVVSVTKIGTGNSGPNMEQPPDMPVTDCYTNPTALRWPLNGLHSSLWNGRLLIIKQKLQQQQKNASQLTISSMQ